MSPKTTNRGIAWLQSEVSALLDIWADSEIQEQLAGRLHNMCIYEKISRKLKDLGFNRTGEQCREKIKKLRRDYKTVIHNNYSPTYARRLLGFYDKVHKVFGKPSDLEQLPDIENALNKSSDNGSENNSTILQSDVEMELSTESFTNSILNTADSFISDIVTDELDSDIHSIKLIKSSKEKLVQEKESMLENIFQNCTLLTETLTRAQNSLNNKLTEFRKKQIDEELERESRGLQFLECQRQKTKSQELKMYNTLLQLLANRKGFEIEFKDSTLSLTKGNLNNYGYI